MGSVQGPFGSLRTSCYTALGTTAIAQTVVPKDSSGNVLESSGASAWHGVLIVVRNARAPVTIRQTASQVAAFTATYSTPKYFWLSVANYSAVGIEVTATTNATEVTNYPQIPGASIFTLPPRRCGVSIGLANSTISQSSFTYAWTGDTSGFVARAVAFGVCMDGEPDPLGTGWSVGQIKY